jgi:hypothetical protein
MDHKLEGSILIDFKFILTNNKNNIILSNKLKIRSQIDPNLSFNIKTNFQLLVLPKKNNSRMVFQVNLIGQFRFFN